MTPAEGQVTVGTKTYQFVELSIDAVMRFQEMRFDEKFHSVDFNKMVEDKKAYEYFRRSWLDFCNSIFVKSFFWSLLAWAGYIPAPLRFSNISLTKMTEITRSFFVYAGALPPQPSKQSGTSADSK